MPIRRNIATNATARQQYVDAVIALKNQQTGVTTSMLGIPGPNRPVSTWDRFVAWHHAAMGVAHRGPLFLPWHRLMLRTLELLLGQAINDPAFGLPYWDWAADGELTTQAQRLNAPVWNDTCMGRASTAPGRFTLTAFPILLEANATGSLVQTRHALRRNRAVGFQGFSNPPLPKRAETAAAIGATPYDVAPWNTSSGSGFRNRVEGVEPSERAAQPRPHLGRRRHAAVVVAQRSRLLPESLQRRPGLGAMDADERAGLSPLEYHRRRTGGPAAERPDPIALRTVCHRGAAAESDRRLHLRLARRLAGRCAGRRRELI